MRLGSRGRRVDARGAEHVRRRGADEREHDRRSGREADRRGDAVVLESPLQGADPVEVRLEQDHVLLDQDAEKGLDPALGAHQGREAALARLTARDVLAQHSLQELLTLGAGRLEHAAQGEIDERSALARSFVLAREVPIGSDHRLAPALAEPAAGRSVQVMEEQGRRGGHRASLAPRGGVVENDAMSLTPSAANAAEIAAMAVPVVAENYGVTLDYGAASLAQLDAIIDDLRRDQRFEALQPLLFSLGCYVGEVLVRHAGGRWRSTEDLGMGKVASSPVAIEMPDGRGCNPVGRVYKRFQKGRTDGLAAFYQAMTGEAPVGP